VPAVLVNLSGQNFVSGSTVVTVSGTGVTVANTSVSGPTSLTTSFTISGAASADARDVTVTTPNGTSNRTAFTIFSESPGCHVSLPVSMSNRGGYLHGRIGIGLAEPTTGTWAVGALYYNGSSISTYGMQILSGTLQAVAPPGTDFVSLRGEPPVIV